MSTVAAPPRERRASSGHQPTCHVCGSQEPVALMRCPLGWYLLACQRPACQVGYTYIMRYSVFRLMRKLHKDDRVKANYAGPQGMKTDTPHGWMGENLRLPPPKRNAS